MEEQAAATAAALDCVVRRLPALSYARASKPASTVGGEEEEEEEEEEEGAKRGTKGKQSIP